jgi:osmotically-inducible protein OsmY
MKTEEMIKNDVEQELRWEPSVCATKIGVSVNGGVVELDGHVGSLYEKWAAERAALRVVNVTAIASEIIVDLPFESERTDEDIASAASSHFTWNHLVPDAIKLKVSKGWVTLQGKAEWHYQKEEAFVTDTRSISPSISAATLRITPVTTLCMTRRSTSSPVLAFSTNPWK